MFGSSLIKTGGSKRGSGWINYPLFVQDNRYVQSENVIAKT